MSIDPFLDFKIGRFLLFSGVVFYRVEDRTPRLSPWKSIIFEKTYLEGEIPMKKIISILFIAIILGGTFLTTVGCSTPPEGSRRGNDGHSSSGGHSH